jgi:thiol-disulfide isomerase/thioredoxin
MCANWRRWAILACVGVCITGCTLSGHGPGRGSGNVEAELPSSAAEPATASPAQQANIEVHAVRYPDLDAAIRRCVGKVVVVDFWLFNCIPCKAGFPYLVQLHEKYGNHGLVVIAVNMDDPAKPAVREQALGFLKTRKARFMNFVLAEGEDPAQWVELRADPNKGGTGFEGQLPFTEVYDRTGRLALHKVEVDHDDLDKLVQELLLKR